MNVLNQLLGTIEAQVSFLLLGRRPWEELYVQCRRVVKSMHCA